MVLVLHGRGDAARYALIRTDRDWLLHRTKAQPRSGRPLTAVSLRVARFARGGR